MDPVVLAAPPWDAIGAVAGVAAVILGLPALVALFVQGGRRSGRVQQGLASLEQRVSEVRDTVNRRVDEVNGRLDRIEGKLDRHLEFHAASGRPLFANPAEERFRRPSPQLVARAEVSRGQEEARRAMEEELEALAPEEREALVQEMSRSLATYEEARERLRERQLQERKQPGLAAEGQRPAARPSKED